MDEAEKMLNEFEFEAVTKARVVATGYVPSIKACEPGYNEARAAVLAAMRKGGVPAGWQLVPVNVTKEMAHALESNLAECLPPSDVHAENWRKAYANMLAAAPQPLAFDRDSIIEACAEAAAAPIQKWNYPAHSVVANIAATVALSQAAIRAMKVQK